MNIITWSRDWEHIENISADPNDENCVTKEEFIEYLQWMSINDPVYYVALCAKYTLENDYNIPREVVNEYLSKLLDDDEI